MPRAHIPSSDAGKFARGLGSRFAEPPEHGSQETTRDQAEREAQPERAHFSFSRTSVSVRKKQSAQGIRHNCIILKLLTGPANKKEAFPNGHIRELLVVLPW
jgi:hypothetical protein